MPLESKVQSSIISYCKRKNWKVLKLITTNTNGIADLLILTLDKDAIFCEVKRPGRKPEPLQEFRQSEFLPYCTGYFWADSLAMFKEKLLTITL